MTDYSPIPEGNNRFDYQRGYADAFDSADELTDDVLAGLRDGLDPLTEEVTDASADGRFATLTGVLVSPE